MKSRTQLGVIGVGLGVVGAILAFALNDEGSTADGVKLEPLGVILLSLGVILLAGLWLSESLGGGTTAGSHDRDGGGDRGDNLNGGGGGGAAVGIHAIGGLIAVVSGIVAVCILAAITLTQLNGKGDKEAIVAITTSAFGIISTVIGAYLGIKISSEAAGNASVEAKHAAVANVEAQNSQQEVSAIKEVVGNVLDEDEAAKVFAAFGRSQPSEPEPPAPAKDEAPKKPVKATKRLRKPPKKD
jgi:hypothetical protein